MSRNFIVTFFGKNGARKFFIISVEENDELAKSAGYAKVSDFPEILKKKLNGLKIGESEDFEIAEIFCTITYEKKGFDEVAQSIGEWIENNKSGWMDK